MLRANWSAALVWVFFIQMSEYIISIIVMFQMSQKQKHLFQIISLEYVIGGIFLSQYVLV